MKFTGKYRYIIPLLAIIIVGAIVLYFVLGGSKLVRLPLDSLPGQAADGLDYDTDILAPGVLQQVEDHLLVDVEIKSTDLEGKEKIIKAKNLAAAWRKLPSLDLGDDKDEVMIADQVLAGDQLYLGQTLAEKGKKRQFNAWQKTFSEAFYDSYSDLYASSLELGQDGLYVRHNPNWMTTLGYTRVLLQAYMLNPSHSLLNKLEELSETLLPLFQSGPPISITGLGPDLNHPLFSKAEEDEIEKQEEVNLISVESIDLWTLAQLAGIDEEWGRIAQQWIENISESISEEGMPFPPEGWNVEQDTAMPLIASDYQAETWRILKTSLNLAEVGINNPSLEGFLLEELKSGGLASSYHLVNGSSEDRSVNPALAARAARLARAVDNEALFAAAARQMSRSYISDQTSSFFGAFARTDNEGRLLINALDQMLVLLALQ